MFKSTRLKIYKTLAALGLFSVEVLVINVVFFFALFIFSYMVREVFIQHDANIDEQIFAFIGSLVSDGNTKFMQAVTFLGTHYFLIPANLVLAAYFFY